MLPCYSGDHILVGECGGSYAGTCNTTTGSCMCAPGWSSRSDLVPMVVTLASGGGGTATSVVLGCSTNRAAMLVSWGLPLLPVLHTLVRYPRLFRQHWRLYLRNPRFSRWWQHMQLPILTFAMLHHTAMLGLCAIKLTSWACFVDEGAAASSAPSPSPSPSCSFVGSEADIGVGFVVTLFFTMVIWAGYIAGGLHFYFTFTIAFAGRIGIFELSDMQDRITTLVRKARLAQLATFGLSCSVCVPLFVEAAIPRAPFDGSLQGAIVAHDTQFVVYFLGTFVALSGVGLMAHFLGREVHWVLTLASESVPGSKGGAEGGVEGGAEGGANSVDTGSKYRHSILGLRDSMCQTLRTIRNICVANALFHLAILSAPPLWTKVRGLPVNDG